MSAYSQQGAKRVKVREAKAENDYFQGIDKVEYNNMCGPTDAAYRHYNGSERLHSRPMEDWLKISVSLTDFRTHGLDHSRSCPWDDGSQTTDNHKRCVKALFEFCSKLGVKYWTAFDTDLVPWDGLDEMKTNWDEMVEFVHELTQKYHVKLLWMAPDLHSHHRYASGAFTSNDATTFTQAATQIKRCLEISQRLNAECFLIWPHRDGYDTIFRTDVHKEIKLFAKLLKITVDYRDRLNYRCQMLLMPYCFGRNYGSYCGSFLWQHPQWRERDLIKSYMWDVTSCLYFLKNYNLDRSYKVCTPPGHHMYMANVYNALGGVVLSGDVDECDHKSLTLMMKSIVDQGSPPPGGIALSLPPRADCRDTVTQYVKYVDACGRALRLACHVNNQQIFTKYVQQRYSTYSSGFGSRLVNNDISIEECEDYYKKNQSQCSESASKSEHIELAFQRYLDTSDHI